MANRDDRVNQGASRPWLDGASLYGPNVTQRSGSVTHADSFGTQIAIRSTAPPPLADYEKWVKPVPNRPSFQNLKAGKTGARMRRIVIMRRQGASWKECGAAVGISQSAAREWADSLPPELAV